MCGGLVCAPARKEVLRLAFTEEKTESNHKRKTQATTGDQRETQTRKRENTAKDKDDQRPPPGRDRAPQKEDKGDHRRPTRDTDEEER